MFSVFTLDKISQIGLDRFDSKKYTTGCENQNPDAIMVRSSAMHDMAFGDNLKAIARAGAGVNNIPLDKCAEQGIVVFNTPGANANAVKELVIAGMLLSSRNIYGGLDWAKTLKGNGAEVGKMVEKGKSKFAGPEISGKTIGVIGLGAIGILVANAAKSLGLKVFGYDPYISVDGAWNLSRDIIHAKSLSEIYENCDFISLHVPLTPDTKGLINSSTIANMKPGVRILNFSRDALVVDNDIIEAIESKKVSAYVTDFPTDEVLAVDGVIAIPHLGASTPESEDNCATMAADEIIEFLENGNIINSVNFPSVSAPFSTAFRIGVIHKNIPNMLTQISGTIAELGTNIDTMVSKSKGDYSYAILDVETAPDVKKIEEIDGVIRVFVFKK